MDFGLDAPSRRSCSSQGGVSGALVLGKSLTPFPKPPAQAQLVRRGAYAMVRHPIYARLMALSLGSTSLWGSLPGAALALIQAVLLGAESAPKSVGYEKSLLTRTNTPRKSDG